MLKGSYDIDLEKLVTAIGVSMKSRIEAEIRKQLSEVIDDIIKDASKEIASRISANVQSYYSMYDDKLHLILNVNNERVEL